MVSIGGVEKKERQGHSPTRLMIHRHGAAGLHHAVVVRELPSRERGMVGGRIGQLFAHQLGGPVVGVLGAAAGDAGHDERHAFGRGSVLCEICCSIRFSRGEWGGGYLDRLWV